MSATKTEIKPLLTKKDVCEKLAISLRTLDRLIEGDKIIGFKVGGSWRMRPENLDRWIEARERVA
jgi:excisionase family DNA binding protein